jgi:hypothetical protein
MTSPQGRLEIDRDVTLDNLKPSSRLFPGLAPAFTPVEVSSLALPFGRVKLYLLMLFQYFLNLLFGNRQMILILLQP